MKIIIFPFSSSIIISFFVTNLILHNQSLSCSKYAKIIYMYTRKRIITPIRNYYNSNLPSTLATRSLSHKFLTSRTYLLMANLQEIHIIHITKTKMSLHVRGHIDWSFYGFTMTCGLFTRYPELPCWANQCQPRWHKADILPGHGNA